MQFFQQIYIYATPGTGQLGANPPGPIWGFGNLGKTNFSMQVSFFNANNVLTNPGAGAEVWINGSNDGLAFVGKDLDFIWNNPSINGDTVDTTMGPVKYIFSQIGIWLVIGEAPLTQS